ncbi:hypothetical protein [Legionella longbeachae]|nr:hypothetical protein [Legionella longbeachae]VEE02874.1 Uncharacterised protein [Legionella oakridgensis]HBD7398921.1 hypothetical protein [Legionella pneumophila]ARM32691.2 hypothetical protein B0B39_03800 [Legionella longbeachae]EEZ94534.1 hypothetical protein LLB_3445 [Legionella longbeachae D-4968]QEY51868.1 hypothetical protein FQU71_11850 [Legionella longbeachae]
MIDPFRNHPRDEHPEGFDYPKPLTENVSSYSSLESWLTHQDYNKKVASYKYNVERLAQPILSSKA